MPTFRYGWFSDQSVQVTKNIKCSIRLNWMLSNSTYENETRLQLPNSHHMRIPNVWLDVGANTTVDEQQVGVLIPYFARFAEPRYCINLHVSL